LAKILLLTSCYDEGSIDQTERDSMGAGNAKAPLESKRMRSITRAVDSIAYGRCQLTSIGLVVASALPDLAFEFFDLHDARPLIFPGSLVDFVQNQKIWQYLRSGVETPSGSRGACFFAKWYT
jgi:hypothetical protein